MAGNMACYVLLAQASAPEVAEQVAQQYQVCPYVHFIAASGLTLVGVWYLPENQRWWLELVAENPQLTLGLAQAAVFRSDTAFPAAAEYASKTRTGDAEVCPCGSDCRECDWFEVCSHCPATTHYRQH